MQLEIWSDIACPWCAIGLRRLEVALEGFPHRDELEIRWRSFELDPSAPARVEGRYVARLAQKYGTGIAGAQAMIDRMTQTAAADGWRFDFERIAPGNTFDAHRLLHLAAEHGLQHPAKEAFLRGYLEDGVAIGDRVQLTQLAIDAGLDADEVAEVLAGDRFAAEVRADEQQARALGIGGVPFFVIDRTYAVEGAQPAEVLRGALEQAWAQRRPLQMVGTPMGSAADGADGGRTADDSCADGRCAI